MCDRISEFYNGKSLFITGASGSLGKVLLEILLRCFPDIGQIYVLLREKKGVNPLDRKEAIFKSRIYKELINKYPNISDKVTVVPGDVSVPDLGLCEDDLQTILREVSIVFHCAAMVNFNKSMRFSAIHNSKGTHSIIKLCQNMKKCDALVYTSTAYANCHIFPNKIEEKIYDLPHSAQKYLDELEHGSDESFSKLVSECKYTWPNSYTFSKCLAENIVKENGRGLPVAVIRPSIIFTCWGGPMPGFLEEGSGIADLSCGVGRGFVKIVRCDPNCRFDLIPCDIVANVHIITAWCMGTNRQVSPFIVNCTSGDVLKLSFSQYINTMYDMSSRNLLPKSFQSQSIRLVETKASYFIYTLYDHYLPAFMLDLFLRFRGSKLRLVKIYKFFDVVMKSLYYFVSTSFTFQNENLKNLPKQLLPEDRQMFYTDLKNVTFFQLANSMPTGSDIFDWKFDRLPKDERKQIVEMRTMIITCIKRITIFLIIYFLYLIISKIFFS